MMGRARSLSHQKLVRIKINKVISKNSEYSAYLSLQPFSGGVLLSPPAAFAVVELAVVASARSIYSGLILS